MPATDHQNLSRQVNEQPANSEPPAQTRFSDPASRQRGAFDQGVRQIASNNGRMVDVGTDNTRVLVDDYDDNESSDRESQIGVRRAIDISPRLPTTHLDVEGVIRTNNVVEGVERQNSRPSRVHKAPSRFDGFDMTMVGMVATDFDKSMDNNNPLVQKAIKAELQQMIWYKTWNGVKTLPEGAHVIPSKIFTIIKYGAEGEFLKFKSRLVAGGHREWLPNDIDTASPTVRFETLMICFCIAAFHGLVMMTGDIGGAFLEAVLDRTDVYVRLDEVVSKLLIELYPEYREIRQHDGTIIVNLVKAMYGLKEASMKFYEHLTRILMNYGFRKSSYDSALMYKIHEDGSLQLVPLHVDDFSAFGQQHHNLTLIKYVKEQFYVVNVNTNIISHQYLGMVVVKIRDGSFLISQPGYIQKTIEEFGLNNDDVVEVPYGMNLMEPTEGPVHEATLFRRRLMMLAFLCRSRPDIKLPIAMLATRMQTPTQQDHLKLLRVAKYINGTRELALKVRPEGLQLRCSADASYNVHQDGKGHTGIVVWIGMRNAPIHVASRKQPTVARSSTESELYASSETGTELVWAKNLMEELGLTQGKIAIEQDNMSAITIMNRGSGRSGKTKHLNKHHFWMTEHINNGDFALVWVPSGNMLADGYTKPLNTENFKTWRNRILNLD